MKLTVITILGVFGFLAAPFLGAPGGPPRDSKASSTAKPLPPAVAAASTSLAVTLGSSLAVSAPVGARDADTKRPVVPGLPTIMTPKSPLFAPIMHNLDSGTPRFIENKGQFHERVKFKVQGGGTLWLTGDGIVFDSLRPLPSPDGKDSKDAKPALAAILPFGRPPLQGLPEKDQKFERLVFIERLMNTSPGLEVEAGKCQPGIYNYFIGNDPKEWVTHVKAYGEVLYRDVWPGIDLRLYGNAVGAVVGAGLAPPASHQEKTGRRPSARTTSANPEPPIANPGSSANPESRTPNSASLEQEFIIHPGADISQIRVSYDGINGLEVTQDGSLLIHTAFGDLEESKPRIYQEIEGQRVPVEGHFRLTSQTAYTFEVPSYQPQYALVIDPTLLYSTYLGGSGSDGASGIAVDSSGNVYVDGVTYSTDFPTTPGAFSTHKLAVDNRANAFVTKLSPLGDHLVYSTYLGVGSGAGIAVDSSGDAYVVGSMLYGLGFPSTSNAYQSCGLGYEATFMTKLSPDGSSLLYSGCFGDDPGISDGFPFGGSGIAVDASGKAYITGGTQSFPTTPSAYQVNPQGGGDAFVAVIDPSASGTSSLVYSTYLGGNTLFGLTHGFNPGNDRGNAIVVDSYGMIYVTGYTVSSNFPVTQGAFQTAFSGPRDCGGGNYCANAFVAKLNPNATGANSLIYSTYLSGVQGASGQGIAVDPSGNAYVSGGTTVCFNIDCVTIPTFPTTPGAFQACPTDLVSFAFVTKLNAAGNGLGYSTCLGGSQGNPGQGGSGIALDSNGDAYVTGSTRTSNFPITADALQGYPGGGGVLGYNAFVTKFNSTGTGLIYSTYLGGGTGDDLGTGIAVDPVGDAYVTGSTASIDFPVTSFAFQPAYGGGDDAFVTKFPLGAPQALSIAGILPTAGGNAGTVTPEIVGGGFHAGATVQLACGGVNISAANVSVGVGGRILDGTFNLVGTSPGTCDVVVSNPDGGSVTLAQAFTVQQGGAPDIHVHKIGTQAVIRRAHPTSPMTYFITVENRGNVDFASPLLAEYLEPWFTFVSADPVPTQITQADALWPPSVVGSGSQYDAMLNWAVPNLPAGPAQSFAYTVNLDNTVPIGGTVSGDACESYVADSQKCNSEFFSLLKQCVVKALAGFGSLAECLLAAEIRWFVCEEKALGKCDTSSGKTTSSNDPNYLVGPAGAGGQRWVAGAEPLTYAIHFENDPSAQVPVQYAAVNDPLPRNIDFRTLRLAGILINGKSVPIPPSFNPAVGLNQLDTNLDLRPGNNLFVQIHAALGPLTHLLSWTFNSIDPTTGQPPSDPTAGFLATRAGGHRLLHGLTEERTSNRHDRRRSSERRI